VLLALKVRALTDARSCRDLIVYSKTLETVFTARTRIERDFDLEAVRRVEASALRVSMS
jgi:hypothetical protein